MLDAVAVVRGAPRSIRVDNGPEFVSNVLDRWAYKRGVVLDFSRPGKPTDNASWNRSMDGCARSASTPTGSCLSTTRGARSRRGERYTIWSTSLGPRRPYAIRVRPTGRG